MTDGIDLPDLPKGWVWTKLGKVAIIASGGTPSTKEAKYFGGDIPWITPADLSGYAGKYISAGIRNITEIGLKSSSARLLPKGTVIFSSRAPVGYVAIAANELCTNQGCKNFILADGVFNEYLYYYLKANKPLAEKYSSGTTFLELSASNAANLPFPLPPLPEQHRIVAKIEELFTKLDAGVSSLEKIKAQLKRYRQAVLKSAMEGRLTEEWREAHKGEMEPASVLLEKIKEERKKNANGKKGKYRELPPLDTSELPELPEGWVWTRLGEVCLEPQYGWTTSAKVQGALHLLRTTDITAGKIDWDSVPFCKEEPPEKGKYLLQDGDIVISRAGSVGYSHLIKNPKEAVFGSYLIRFKPLTSGEYLSYFLQSPSYWQSIAEKSLGIALANVNATKLKQIFIPLPPLPEQHKIVEEIERRFSVADEVEKTVEQGLKQAQRLRQSILKSAFEGKLVPQDPSDEPASILLERIKEEKAMTEKKTKEERSKNYKQKRLI